MGNLNKPNVNTACLPSCRDQFGHQFNNGTGEMLGGRMGKERGGRLLPVHPAQGGSSSCREQQLQQQAEERPEPAACWKRQQVQPEPERDLCGRSGGKGCLYRRWRQSPRLPGPVWQVDCCWTCHLGCWMRQRCARSLCKDVTFHPVDRSELDLFICLNNFISEGNFCQFPSNKSLCVEAYKK